MKLSNILSAWLTVFCFSVNMLMPFPVRAEEQDYDSFFIVINEYYKRAEYYYHINGVLHHIPADFSLVPGSWNFSGKNMFTVQGDYYIRNDWPIQIKFGENTEYIPQNISDVFDTAELTLVKVNTTEQNTHPMTEFVFEDENHKQYTCQQYQEFPYGVTVSDYDLDCVFECVLFEDTLLMPLRKLDTISYAYVIGVDDPENPEYYAISTGGQPWYFTLEDLPGLADTELHFGDILQRKNIRQTNGNSSNEFYFWFESGTDDRQHSMTVIGSLLDAPTAEFSVTGKASYAYVKVSDAVQEYQLYLPYYLEFRKDNLKFLMPDIPSVNSVQTGDTVTCALNSKGIPIMMLSIVSDGDANGDQKLNILDVIMINKAVLGKESLNPDRIPHVDFNQNGVPDSDDSLTMLKKIVGLA